MLIYKEIVGAINKSKFSIIKLATLSIIIFLNNSCIEKLKRDVTTGIYNLVSMYAYLSDELRFNSATAADFLVQAYNIRSEIILKENVIRQLTVLIFTSALILSW